MAKKRRNSKSSSSKSSPKGDEDDEKEKSNQSLCANLEESGTILPPPPVVEIPKPQYDHYDRHSSSEDSDYEDVNTGEMMPEDIQLMILGDCIGQVTIHQDSDDDDPNSAKCDIDYDNCNKVVKSCHVESPVKEADPSQLDVRLEKENVRVVCEEPEEQKMEFEVIETLESCEQLHNEAVEDTKEGLMEVTVGSVMPEDVGVELVQVEEFQVDEVQTESVPVESKIEEVQMETVKVEELIAEEVHVEAVEVKELKREEVHVEEVQVEEVEVSEAQLEEVQVGEVQVEEVKEDMHVETVKEDIKKVKKVPKRRTKNLKSNLDPCDELPKPLPKPKVRTKTVKSETKCKTSTVHKPDKRLQRNKSKSSEIKGIDDSITEGIKNEAQLTSVNSQYDATVSPEFVSSSDNPVQVKGVCDVCKSAKSSTVCKNCQVYSEFQNGDIIFKEVKVLCQKMDDKDLGCSVTNKTFQGGDGAEKQEGKDVNILKEVGFRSRSGSTDTSLSESGSNSSGSKRRSSRIKSCKEVSAIEVPPAPKEVVPVIPPPPVVNASLLNYSLDRPVKVKSRWRRTSELEMGGGAAVSNDLESSLSAVSATSVVKMDVEEETPLKPDPEIETRLKSFEVIQQNEYLTQRSKSKEAKRMVCDCTLSKEEISRGELGCGEDCLNRLLMLECGSRCSLGSLCSNRRFQNFEYAGCEVISTDKKGLGLIAKEDISGGQFIMEYVGEVLDPKEFRKRAKDYAKEKNRHYYFMALKSDAIIDATVKGNISRFINHSCDPNAETQKWTVNGELRIGFFSKRTIGKGEEITFDYQLQRYGKEAQRCHCESILCRGWIGEEPEKEREKERKDWSKKEKKEKKRKEEKRRDIKDYLNDMDLEEEVEKLSSTGLKNKAHTLTLCRLMVRAEDERSRSQLLSIAQEGDARCLRLFLDYHGLSLIWSWMVDSCSPNKLKLKILETLSVLPITNKTILQDSKVLSVVHRWGDSKPEKLSDRKERGSTEDEDKSPNENEDVKMDEEDSKNHEDAKLLEDSEKVNVKEKAEALLLIWSNLKEEFRIPKKERIEQMKEHEREADQGYVDPRELQSYDRHWSHEKEGGRFRERDTKEKKKGKESPDGINAEWHKKSSRPEERNGQSQSGPKMSKAQRRQLFALKVEEEERQKKQVEEQQQKIAEELWQKHQEQCSALGLNPETTPLFNAPNGFPSFYHPVTSSLHPFPPPPDGVVPQPGLMEPCDLYGPPPSVPPPAPPGGPMFPGPPPRGVPLSAIPPPNFPPPLHPPPDLLTPPPSLQPQHFIGPPPFVEGTPPLIPSYPPPPIPSEPPSQVFPDTTLPPNQGFNYPPPSLPIQFPPPAQAQPPLQVTPEQEMTAQAFVPTMCSGPPPLPQMVKLPAKWKTAKDSEGRLYYYHRRTRKSQWHIPVCDPTQPTESSSESSESSDDDESSTDEDDDDEREEDDVEEHEEEEVIPFMKEITLDEALEPVVDSKRAFESIPIEDLLSEPILKKKRDGLVQVAIISPRDDSYYSRKGIKKSKIKENKEKARHKKKRSHETSAKCEADTSSGPKRRIKDAFRMSMANVIVAVLNPYRKSSCTSGRITNTEDFKHLARKLTHFVMTKELRQLNSVEELKVNDSVKHKAKDFVRKYMNRFGPVYKRSPND